MAAERALERSRSVMKPGHELQRSVIEKGLHPTSQCSQDSTGASAWRSLALPGVGAADTGAGERRKQQPLPQAAPRQVLLGRRGGHLEGQGDPARAQHAEITKRGVCYT